MKKNKLLLIVGIIVMLVPLSGFPRDFKNVTLYIAGLIVVTLSVIAIRQDSRQKIETKKSDVFEESKPNQSDFPNNNHIADL